MGNRKGRPDSGDLSLRRQGESGGGEQGGRGEPVEVRVGGGGGPRRLAGESKKPAVVGGGGGATPARERRWGLAGEV